MKTIVAVEIDDEGRDVLANLMDQKDTKRMMSRKEITALCQRHIAGLVLMGEAFTYEEEPTDEAMASTDVYDIDHDDPLTKLMAHPDNDSYVRGWNQAARS